MEQGLELLVSFLTFAIPKLPGLIPVVKDFWGANKLGPMPPDLQAWDTIDAQTDADLRARVTKGE